MSAVATFSRNAPVVRHLRITGQLQGVFYRAGMSLQADALGVCGWVRNRKDGSVEAMACGTAQSLRALIEWAHRGPPSARVHRVEVRPVDTATESEVFIDFAVREAA